MRTSAKQLVIASLACLLFVPGVARAEELEGAVAGAVDTVPESVSVLDEPELSDLENGDGSVEASSAAVPDHADGWEYANDGTYYWIDGQKIIGWLELDGTQYYFALDDGRMYSNGVYEIEGQQFSFSDDGALISDSSVDQAAEDEGGIADAEGSAGINADAAGEPTDGSSATSADSDANEAVSGDDTGEYEGTTLDGQDAVADEPLAEKDVVTGEEIVSGAPTDADVDEGAIADPAVNEPNEKPEVQAEGVEPAKPDNNEAGISELTPEASGWIEQNGVKNYFDPETGNQLKGGFFTIEGKKYCFDPAGALVTGWIVSNGEVYYFDPADGAMVTNTAKLIQGLCAPINAADGAAFADVNNSNPHKDDVNWMLASGISTGWVSSDGKRTFKPMSYLARADMAAFLYRLAGSPDFIPTNAQAAFFSDVNGATPHAREIWWLASTGISEGWAAGGGKRAYRPMSALARADMAAFLYRLAGSPTYSPTSQNKTYFSDVNNSTPHALEIWWLGGTGVSEGFAGKNGTRSFRPYSRLARQDMAAFLHRMVTDADYKPTAEHEYLFDADGTLETGWVNDSFYDLSTGAHVEAGWIKNGANVSYLDPTSKKILKNGPHDIAGFKYLFDNNGNLRRGWITYDGAKHFFERESGMMYRSGTYKVDGASYRFDDNGALVYGWVKIGGASYFFDRSTGKMYTNGIYRIDNALYQIAANGRATKLNTNYPAMLSKAQGYYSPTNYLILVDCGGNVVVVFQGRKGTWAPIKEFRCTSGAPYTPTVKGVFSVGAKGYSFGAGTGHTCYWYTQIYGDYLFHSILYHEGTFNVLDGRLGIDASAGCVRLAIENAKWIYDNIPYGSTIVTY